MDRVRYAVIGAGMSGLAFANFVGHEDVLIFERDESPGGYCKTVHQDGFVWDYSGHFFHFRHPEVEAYLRERMGGQEILTVHKAARILFKGELVDFPFQKNIHQLPKADFVDCLYDLVFRPELDGPPESFEAMLYSKFGRGITERFLVPYNEKLYACDLSELDADAMGRFFPHADLEEIVRNFRKESDDSYNATFTYPRGGAIEYVNALLRDVPDASIAYGEAVESVDLAARTLRTSSGRVVGWERLISSAPFDRLMHMVGAPVDPDVFSSNKVHVFNLGFDRKGPRGVHWVYVPERRFCFYRVGFYDNIFDDERMSLYVEIGKRSGDPVDPEGALAQVLEDLEAAGIVDGHQLVSSHQVVLDPAYVHVRAEAREAFSEQVRMLNAAGVYPIGRYGGWTYCSIEDNIVEARELASTFNALDGMPSGGRQEGA